jgi:hypothetical protein
MERRPTLRSPEVTTEPLTVLVKTFNDVREDVTDNRTKNDQYDDDDNSNQNEDKRIFY